MKNSQLPGIATRAIVRSKEDPVCGIYLHGKGAKEFSAWEKGILEQIFDGRSLAALVDSAMKGYAKDPGGYTSAKPAEQEEIRKIGIAPFMTIYQIAIDDKRKEAILCARTELDGNLIEHGINIYLKKGKWHFSDAEYYINYADKLGPTLEEEEEESEEPTPDEKRFDKLFPPPKRGVPVEKDTKVLHGRWIYDRAKTRKLYLKLGRPLKQLDSDMVMPPGSILEFTSNSANYTRKGGGLPLWEHSILGCERAGDCVTQRYQSKYGNQWTDFYWLYGKDLVSRLGRVFRQARGSEKSQSLVKEYDGPMPENYISKLFPPAKRGMSFEANSPALHGKWRFDTAGTRKIQAAAGVSTEETDIYVKYSEKTTMEFSAKTFTVCDNGKPPGRITEVTGCQRRGNWMTVRHLIGSRVLMTSTYWLDDDGSLVDVSGKVFQRTK